MENNFELGEMKQQWSTLQTALNNQVQINIKQIQKSVKSHYSWLKRNYVMSFIGVPIGILSCWFLKELGGIPLPICIFIAVIILIQGLVNIYLYCNIPNPLDTAKSILSISHSFVKFRRVFISSIVFGCIMLLCAVLWTILITDLSVNPMLRPILFGAIGGFVGAMICNKIAFNHLKELREDFHLMREWKEQ